MAAAAAAAAAASRVLRVCVVGSGPAGFYTAMEVLKGAPHARVDMIERNPVPFGLVRYGVAPDHPEVKLVQQVFEQTAQDPRFRFFGNVTVGKDVSMEQLRTHFDAVVVATGAARARKLDIPGVGLQGVITAREFVGWYNGEPWHADLNPPLDHPDAVIIGAGNVALDVARVLLGGPERFASTDIAAHATAALKQSAVRRVFIAARRGAIHASFAARELREVLKMPLHISVQPHPLRVDPAERDAADRAHQRVFALLDSIGGAAPAAGAAPPALQFRFEHTPVAFLPDPQRPRRVGAVRFALPRPLDSAAAGTASAPTLVDLPCGLALLSLGFDAVPLPGLPLERGRVPNTHGRVHGLPGVYVAGWAKAPGGNIAAAKFDAEETAAALLADAAAARLPPARADGWPPAGLHPISYADWRRVDAAEVARGAARGKPREKIVQLSELLRTAESASADGTGGTSVGTAAAAAAAAAAAGVENGKTVD